MISQICRYEEGLMTWPWDKIVESIVHLDMVDLCPGQVLSSGVGHVPGIEYPYSAMASKI